MLQNCFLHQTNPQQMTAIGLNLFLDMWHWKEHLTHCNQKTPEENLGYQAVMEEEVNLAQDKQIHHQDIYHCSKLNQVKRSLSNLMAIATSFPTPNSSTTMLGNTPRFPMYSPSHHPSSIPLSSFRSNFIIAPSGNEISSSAIAEYS